MRISLICLLLLGCLGLWGQTEKVDEVIAKAAENFAGLKTLRADFRQTRILKNLDMEIRTDGEMLLEKGKRLGWHVRSPIRYYCIISEQEFRQWDGETGEVIKLSAERMPWLKLLFSNLSSWMAADLTEMRKQFTFELINPRRLSLTPTDRFFQQYIKGVEFEFDESYTSIRQIQIEEKGGDLIRIDFHSVQRNPVIQADAWLIPPR